MNHYENKILSSDSDIETLQTHILSNPKRNSSNRRILAGFCRSSLGKPMSSIDDIGFQRIMFLKFNNGSFY